MSQSDLARRTDEFLTLFRKGAELSQELIEENRRLRAKLDGVEQRQSDALQTEDGWGKLREELLNRIQGLEEERDDASTRLRTLADENRQFMARYMEVEEENNNLANLYVSSFQLHASLDLSQTLQTIVEIVINLIGGERFGLFLHDEKSGAITPVAAEGVERSELPHFHVGEGTLGQSLESGEVVYGTEEDSGEDAAGLERPLVCIPLRLQDIPIGAIAIYRLLSHKETFTPLDHELFTLLAGHAATAIFAAQLHGQSERKLNTIQGFLELLTK